MIDGFYDTEFTVKRKTTSKDSGGAVTDTYSTDDSYYGFFESLSANELVMNQKNGVAANYRLYCSLDTDVSEDDKIEISSVTYDIDSIITFSIGDSTHYEIYLKRSY